MFQSIFHLCNGIKCDVCPGTDVPKVSLGTSNTHLMPLVIAFGVWKETAHSIIGLSLDVAGVQETGNATWSVKGDE